MSIAWDSFLTVVIASIVGTALIVSLYSLGIRFLTDAQALMAEAATGNSSAIRRESIYRSIAYVCFTLCAIAVLYAVYLIVPAFHLK